MVGDKAFEGGFTSRQRCTLAEQVRVMVHTQDDGKELERELFRVGAFRCVSVATKRNGFGEFLAPPLLQVGNFVFHRACDISKFSSADDEETPTRAGGADPLQPPAKERAQTRQPPLFLERRNEDFIHKLPRTFFKHSQLQVFARTEVREHPALGTFELCRQRADGQPFEPQFARLPQRGAQDDLAAHGPFSQFDHGHYLERPFVFVKETGRVLWPPRLTEPDDGLSPLAKAMRQAQPWLSATSKVVNGAVVGVVGGMLADKYLGWAPWGTVGLSVLGISVGLYGFLRDAMRMGKK